MADNGIYIDKDEFIMLINQIFAVLIVNGMFADEQRSSMYSVYTEVQENAITENYTLILSMLISMTRMCYEMTDKAANAFKDMGDKMISIDGFIEKCVEVIKNGEGK